MVNAATAHHDLLVKHGMPEAMLDDLYSTWHHNWANPAKPRFAR